MIEHSVITNIIFYTILLEKELFVLYQILERDTGCLQRTFLFSHPHKPIHRLMHL